MSRDIREMTAYEAKEWSLMIWKYLADHPKKLKCQIPNKLFKYKGMRLLDCHAYCPLCSYCRGCIGCPLDVPLGNHCVCGDYFAWRECVEGKDKNGAKLFAKNIVERIKSWNLGD